MNYPHPIIAREGWPFIAIAVVVAILIQAISGFMHVFNVHSQRSPVDGAISKVEYFPGAYLNAAVDKASTENERNAIVIETAGGQTVTSVQIAGLIARRILCY